MPADRAATEISYASSAENAVGRMVIRVMENCSGRRRLVGRARGYREDVNAGQNFWEVMAARYGLSLEVTGGSLGAIPRDGPLVVVANHPFGILDGLAMGLILSRSRSDFRIVANDVFLKAPDLEGVVLPIAFDESPGARRRNVTTRAAARAHLAAGGAVGIFPGGTVSTSARPLSRPLDPGWGAFTGRLVARSGATVVPVLFEGANSRLFQIASHLHMWARLGLLINEFRRRTDRPVRFRVGPQIGPGDWGAFHGDPHSMMDFLRDATYEMSPMPVPKRTYGLDFGA